VYIAGDGRSGGTLLAKIMGQMPGFFAAGELYQIWRQAIRDNAPCGCGAPFVECGVWKAVLHEAFGNTDYIDTRELIAMQRRHAGIRHIPKVLTPSLRSSWSADLESYLHHLKSLYHAIQSTTGCTVIVESSRALAYGRILRMIPTIDLYVVHLVRDPRAVAYSRLRRRFTMEFDPMQNALRWNRMNLGVEAILKIPRRCYMMLRYEDFVEEPDRGIRRMLAFIHEDRDLPASLTERKIDIGVCHTCWGNPNRFQTGLVELRPDDEWLALMNERDLRRVTVLTWPLLIRYKYPIYPLRSKVRFRSVM
jgi:hypothetical protein